MSGYESRISRPSSTPGSSSSNRARGSGSVDRATADYQRLRQNSLPELPYIQRVRSTPMCSGNSMSEAFSRSRKPSFKIGLPFTDPSMLPNSFSKVISRGPASVGAVDESVTILQEPLLSSFLPPFLLTPPEEVQTSPLEALLSASATAATCPLSIDHFDSETASMASNDSIEEYFEAVSSTIEEMDSGNVAINFNNIATSIVNELAKINMPTTAMSVVHQPLPFPLPQRLLNNDPSITTLFSQLTGALRNDHRLPTTGIRVFHTLPDKLPQENLPTSPPVTPSYLSRNSNQQAQGYFTLKPLYLSVAGSTGLVVPPGEALVTITERIIPPSAEFEISSFLNEAPDSGFRERLSELGKGGLFILVLPTESGGRTFHKEYLSKLLDPILRNLIVRLGLHTQLASDISNAKALDQLSSFENTSSRITSLLQTINTSSPSANQPQYSLLSTKKGCITLPFEAWYSWWLGQERTRIMGLLNYYLNIHGQGLGVASSVSRSSIMHEIEECMLKAGAAIREAGPGIELGVHIVQRTS